MEINQVYNENCLNTMSRMPDGFIDLTVTSPPYDNLRDYKGYSFPFEEIARELYRVTKEGGVVVWVVADQTINGSETGTSFRQALYFMDCGFRLHDTMIYERLGAFPETTRYHPSFEYMFVFCKGKLSTFNPICDRKNNYYGTSYGGKTQRTKDGKRIDSIAKKKNVTSSKTHTYRKNIWKIQSGNGHSTNDDYAWDHPAIFPEALAKDHIISWSNEGDLVYDPFIGSGTTAKMAILKKRNFIGSEMAEEYMPIIERRIRDAKIAMTQGELKLE